MPATPVIRPWYDPSFDMGVPAIVSYWTAFIGQRQFMFELGMKQRLASLGDDKLGEQMLAIREQIGELEKVKANIQRGSLTDFAKLVIEEQKGAVQLEVTDRQNQAKLAEQRIESLQRQAELEYKRAVALTERTALDGSLPVLGGLASLLAGTHPDAQQDAFNRTFAQALAAEGVTASDPKADQVRRQMLKIAANTATPVYQASAAAWGITGHPDAWFEGKYPGTTEAERDAERARITSHGVSRSGPLQSGIMGLLGAGPSGPVPAAGTGWGAGAGWGAPAGTMPVPRGAAGPTGEPAPADGEGASVQPGQVGGPLAAARDAWYQQTAASSVASVDEQIASLKSDLAALAASRQQQRSSARASPFAGYSRNILLETPFVVPAHRGRWGRVQRAADTLNAASPVEREEALIALNQARPGPGRARRALDDLTAGHSRDLSGNLLDPAQGAFVQRPGDDLREAGAMDPGGRVNEYLLDQLVSINWLADDDKPDDAVKKLIELSATVDKLELVPEARDIAGPTIKAIRDLTALTGHAHGEPRLLLDPDDGGYIYRQDANGRVYYATVANGQPTSAWTPGKGTSANAITKRFGGPHPAQSTDPASALAVGVTGAIDATIRHIRDAGDVAFAELAADAIAPALETDDRDAATRHLDGVGRWTWDLPAELTGGYGEALARTFSTDTNKGDMQGMLAHAARLQAAGYKIGKQEREAVQPEDRDAMLDNLEAQMLASLERRGKLKSIKDATQPPPVATVAAEDRLAATGQKLAERTAAGRSWRVGSGEANPAAVTGVERAIRGLEQTQGIKEAKARLRQEPSAVVDLATEGIGAMAGDPASNTEVPGAVRPPNVVPPVPPVPAPPRAPLDRAKVEKALTVATQRLAEAEARGDQVGAAEWTVKTKRVAAILQRLDDDDELDQALNQLPTPRANRETPRSSP